MKSCYENIKMTKRKLKNPAFELVNNQQRPKILTRSKLDYDTILRNRGKNCGNETW